MNKLSIECRRDGDSDYYDNDLKYVICSRVVKGFLDNPPPKILVEIRDEPFDGSRLVVLQWDEFRHHELRRHEISYFEIHLPSGTLKGTMVFSLIENELGEWGEPTEVYLSITAID